MTADGYLYGSLIDILNHSSKVVILATGMTLVIATGGVDISVGSVMAIAGAAAASVIVMPREVFSFAGGGANAMAFALAVLLALALATCCGVWNGFLTAGCGIQPMVATLVLMVAGRGIAQLITDGTIITFDDPYLNFIGNGHFLTLPFTTWIAATLFTTVVLLTRKTALGLFVESVGNNEKASRYAGIEARGVKWLVYAVSGFCAGVAGLMVSSNIKCADANHAGLYLELDAILATVIGGTSMAGGRFYLSGSLVGAVLIQTVATMMYANDVNPAIVAVPKAVIVIVVCLLQSETFRSKLALAFSRKAKGGAA
jgi:simple sugar transport system permease protein